MPNYNTCNLNLEIYCLHNQTTHCGIRLNELMKSVVTNGTHETTTSNQSGNMFSSLGKSVQPQQKSLYVHKIPVNLNKSKETTIYIYTIYMRIGSFTLFACVVCLGHGLAFSETCRYNQIHMLTLKKSCI